MRTNVVVITVTVAVLAAFAPLAYSNPVYESKAADVALTALERAVRVGGDEVVPKDALRGARAGRVLVVHHAGSLEPAYALVPIETAAGEALGILGLSPEADRVLWYRFGVRGAFPAISGQEAQARAALEVDRPGREPGLGEPLLIEGHDKHLYWRLEGRSGDVWLIDAEQPDRAVLGTALGTAGEALLPDAKALNRQRPQKMPPGLLGGQPACLLGSGPRPAAYDITGLPDHYQITSWYCGPASLQMFFDYYGEEIGQHNIADVANDIVDEGCYCDDMARSAHFSGMSIAIQDPTLQGYVERQLGYGCVEYWWGTDPDIYDEVKDILRAHYPIMACTWYSPTHSAGHFRVLKGYDDSLSVFIIHDPWYYGSISGPNLLVDQTLFVENLWRDWSWCWGISPAPWLVRPEFPSSVSQGDTFAVDVTVAYRSPLPVYPMAAHNCSATITLSPGLTLAGGSGTVALPNIVDGDSTTVSWDIIATGSPGEEGMAFQAKGTIDYYTYSYGDYSDSIGGHSYETVEITDVLLAGWDPEERLTNDTAAQITSFPGARTMVVDDAGNAHLVWQDTRDGGSSIYYRMRSGSTWQTEEKITGDTVFCHSPCIDAGPDGSLHVAYVCTVGEQGNAEIYYKSWTAAGGWSDEERVTNYHETDLNPSVAAGDSLVYIAWESRQGGLFRAHAVFFSIRSGLGWCAPVDVDGSPARDSFRPSLAYGADGLLHIVYERHTANEPNENEKVVHKSWDGAVWSGRTGLSSDLSYSRTPVIAAGDDSTLHVVWQDGENGTGDIFYAMYDGAVWQPAEQIVTGGTEASMPSVAWDGLGNVHVVWSDHRHAETEIYYMTKDGGGWGDEARLTRASGSSTLPAVGATPAGDVCVVWTDLRHGDAELYFVGTESDAGVDPHRPVAAGGAAIRLAAPYPMPFASETNIDFWLARPSDVSLEVFDVQGRLVKTVADGHFAAGIHQVAWNGRNSSGQHVESGVYYLRCKSPMGWNSRRMVLIR